GPMPMQMFMQVYDEIQMFLLEELELKFDMDPNRVRYLRKMMDTTCLGGKYNRGLTVIDVAESLLSLSPNNNGEEDDGARRKRVLHDACVCGWMIEFLQAHYLVEDDIMDNSVTRRGKPCWYRHPDVTVQCAINDGLLLKSWTHMMAMHFFADRPFLQDLLCRFNRVDYTTAVGQLYDVTSMFDSNKLDPDVSQPTTTDFAEFTLSNYKRIVKYKTAYYTYLLPLVMGLIVSEALPTVDMGVTEELAMLMGEYFQVQDDVMDCFTPPERLGKVGTDIQDAKCSWLAVTFLAKASSAQVAEFKANYGSGDSEKVATVRRLYEEADLQGDYVAYEAAVAEQVKELIEKLRLCSPGFAASVETLWGKTYKRQK
uniref:Farnesyl pyrophosphate synthase n=1 Tax=Trypanosoma brucei TaxID=5691 RepID=UPI00142F3CF2|nr:Chain A, Farnesyl pyrophosphate synthase [Trypanosoma brucei]5QT5_A Chain A, Farnesyl pyrophosphate synthase [Trypanosoma brucei]5QT6_A Chain A, Farnesyl pyrophosphate synthase [Trypanosoma brucei]5QT7_A Chain A, Farnesyl pyrophosphate synthase [Trypanosoma brucei]5QT8_A Chain A, Farnesyl pyrophosphate synthase [Trypanosoma brucei]5QT9_A Chain A, Farnesyl pyrophosphate synthase [Trypanosoma brucei]5QTA_A Chain A, Farnesyl pyrophosphate synthase [Trypanosoma brucei]5QTB_A Chain A, Farnesyl